MKPIVKVSSSGCIVEMYNSSSHAAKVNFQSVPTMNRYCLSGQVAPDGWLYRQASEQEIKESLGVLVIDKGTSYR
jgi:hypothetical protein